MSGGRILGAVLAGGAARRFGSDKAMALLDGRPLIQHVLAALGKQVDTVVVAGRSVAGYEALADRPGPGLGPLAGLCAALHHAARNGFDAVVSVSCDTPLLPDDLVARLAAEAPSQVEGHYLIGCWPAALAGVLDAHLAGTQDRSLRGWGRRVGARAVRFAQEIANVNRPEDLERLRQESAA